jgi:hypothetical protein
MPSAVIREYEYDASRRELRVTFQSGKRYVYQDVPAETHTAMRHAFSKGAFFNAHIRDHFPFTQEDLRKTLPMNKTHDPGPRLKSVQSGLDDKSGLPFPGTAPIETPDPTDADPSAQADEVPKVGSKDAPGG